MERILIRGGRVLDPSRSLDMTADVLVADGVVAEIREGINPAGARIIEAADCVVAPGFVDLHAHLREPGYEQKGTVRTETTAALRGGFTTVCAMPNTRPAPDCGPVLESIRDIYAREALVRVLPIGCITRGREGKELAELAELAAGGVVAFSDDGSPVADPRLMRNALALAGALGLPVSEHCDSPEMHAGGAMNEGAVSERLGLSGQPSAAEAAAIARNIELAAATGGRLHIAHVTTERGVELVAEARRRGLPVTCEVTPSHLFLTEDAVAGTGDEPAYDTSAKINPPLRTETDRRALLAALNAGLIDAIATDHAPHAIEEKLVEFEAAAFGISCFESAVSTLLTLVYRGELRLERMVEALTTAPVRCFGLAQRVPGIGTLEPGVARDVVVLDPRTATIVDPERWASKGKNTPLAGRELKGVVRAVIFEGTLAWEREAAHV
ncbi:MAG: dihydroorotase [Tepidiforma sp.]|nr:MAG: dihydroorotase [Tepidiforma sp.]